MTFKIGVMKLLNKYKYSTFETDDLWNIMRESANSTIDVRGIYDVWIKRAGFPIVEVQGEGNRTKLTQRRFVKPFQNNT